ncbi:MAG: hypothetical protein LBN27_06560 [Prevotellaceae bacterium]|jgi:hypothetical protein|nr:hypothetical protein [Prevotellaceae bacterium]
MKRFVKTKFFTLATKSLSGCSLTGLDKSYNAFVKAITKVNQPSASVYYNALCYVRVELVSLKNQLTESLKKWRIKPVFGQIYFADRFTLKYCFQETG